MDRGVDGTQLFLSSFQKDVSWVQYMHLYPHSLFISTRP